MKKNIVLLLGVAIAAAFGQPQKGSFVIDGERFLLNGRPFRIMSGEMHYPRIPREYWLQRMQMARAMGLNTVCTYLFWDLHEPSPGKFDFSGALDVAAFVRTAGEAGLNVIIRPGPYVCSEWDLGGLPSWLLKDRAVSLRCMDPAYVKAAERYLARVGKELAPLQVDRGGPIILVQVENEYGSYGNDKAYMARLERSLRSAGFTVPLFTSDGPSRSLLEAGTLPGVLPVVNFGGGPREAFQELAAFRPGIPQMNGEFWCGWFTHWGDSAWGASNTAVQREELRWMLENGKSFNLYMFHGGTNFGWMAGANHGAAYEPDVTSYDYDAPLDERGAPTKKYFAFREVLAAFQPPGVSLPEPPAVPPVRALTDIRLTEFAALFDQLPGKLRIVQPRSMEELGQDYGYILYRTRLLGPKSGTLTVTEPHDYALVYLNGRLIDTLDRTRGKFSIRLPESNDPAPVLDILVEAMGRVNFGQHLIDRKGITERVTLRGVTLMNWDVFLLPMDTAARGKLMYAPSRGGGGPRFYRGSFDVADPADAFLDMKTWPKGVVWINGHHLGRYWTVGPQTRLYVPGVWLKTGRNEIVVFDVFGPEPKPLNLVEGMKD